MSVSDCWAVRLALRAPQPLRGTRTSASSIVPDCGHRNGGHDRSCTPSTRFWSHRGTWWTRPVTASRPQSAFDSSQTRCVPWRSLVCSLVSTAAGGQRLLEPGQRCVIAGRHSCSRNPSLQWRNPHLSGVGLPFPLSLLFTVGSCNDGSPVMWWAGNIEIADIMWWVSPYSWQVAVLERGAMCLISSMVDQE